MRDERGRLQQFDVAGARYQRLRRAALSSAADSIGQLIATPPACVYGRVSCDRNQAASSTDERHATRTDAAGLRVQSKTARALRRDIRSAQYLEHTCRCRLYGRKTTCPSAWAAVSITARRIAEDRKVSRNPNALFIASANQDRTACG